MEESTMIKRCPIILYSTDDVCKMLHIGKLTCLNLFHRSDFPAQKYGRAYRVEESALREYLSQRHILNIKKRA